MTSALLALLVGAVLGFVLSIPAAGPLLALVVLAGASGDSRRGIALAVGGALAESAWALFALWGLARLLETHAPLVPVLRGLCALLLGVLAILLFRARPEEPTAPADRRALGPALLGFSLVALNPGFPLTWAAVAAALYSSKLITPSSAVVAPLAIGVFVGIVVWFWMILRLSRRFGRRFDARARRRWARVVGVLLLCACAWLVALVVQGAIASARM